MADLYHKQAKIYVAGRPSYPDELFEFIGSKTRDHELVWDVGTGSGQAAMHLARIFKKVIATDTSKEQLDHAPKFSNINYVTTPPTMTITELESNITSQSTLDLVTVAQALHWFDLPTFYQQVRYVLKKPHGVMVAWCYTIPEVNIEVDSVYLPLYESLKQYWGRGRELIDDKYTRIEFPFDPVDGLDHTGPFEFKAEQSTDLEGFITYIKSGSAYNTAKKKGVEMLGDEVVEKFKQAWGADGEEVKVVRFPVHLRIGKVGSNTI